MMETLSVGDQVPERVQGHSNLEEVIPIKVQERADCCSRLKEQLHGLRVRVLLEPLNKALPEFCFQLLCLLADQRNLGKVHVLSGGGSFGSPFSLRAWVRCLSDAAVPSLGTCSRIQIRNSGLSPLAAARAMATVTGNPLG